MDAPFPQVTQALIDALDRLYPDQAPDPRSSMAEVWYAAGRASVVRKLKLELKRQNPLEQ